MDLIGAVRKGDCDKVKALLDSGEDIHYQDDRALSTAVSFNHIKVVELLLNANPGSNIHARNDVVIQIAAREGHAEIAKLLIKYGVDVSSQDNNALMSAAEFNHIETVKVLLDSGKTNVQCIKDYVFIIIVQHSYIEMVKLLLKYGYDVRSCINRALIKAISSGSIEMIKFLLDDLATDISHNDYEAFQTVVECNRIDIVHLLIKRDLKCIHVRNDWAIRESCRRKYHEMIKILLSYGAKFDAMTSYYQEMYSHLKPV